MFHRMISSAPNGGGDGDSPDNNIISGALPASSSTTQDDDYVHNSQTTTAASNNLHDTPHANEKQHHLSGHESLLRFLLLPRQVLIVLTLEFLNSFRSFGLRFVLYNYVTNEFGISDVQAGALLGIKGIVDILFGLLGSIMVDVIGVRRISILATSIAIVGRTLLAFGRTKQALYFALFLFSPCGDALLSVGLHRVALKKLTTPLTRPLAFAMSYAASNLAGALADVLVDQMRGSLEDVQMSGGAVFTPIRQFIVVTWVIVLVTFTIAYCFLEDWTVIDPNDLDLDESEDERRRSGSESESAHSSSSSMMMANEMGGNESIIPMDALPASPMIRPHLLHKWFPNHYDSISIQQAIEEESEEDAVTSSDVPVTRSLPKYQMYRTRYNHQTSSQHGGRERYCSEDNMTINRIKLGCTNNRYGSSNSNRLVTITLKDPYI